MLCCALFLYMATDAVLFLSLSLSLLPDFIFIELEFAMIHNRHKKSLQTRKISREATSTPGRAMFRSRSKQRLGIRIRI